MVICTPTCGTVPLASAPPARNFGAHSKSKPEKRSTMQKATIDRTDKRILGELQRQAKLSMNQLGDRVGLSQTPCWRRIKRLEDAGVIRRRVALLDPAQLQLTVNVFVELKVSKPADSRILASAVQTIPEILEC